jgi:FeS assembly SUF system protein
MHDKTAPTVDPVRLPVLPTGRLDELRRAMQDDTKPTLSSPVVESEHGVVATTAEAVGPAGGAVASLAPSVREPAPLLERKQLEGKVIEVIRQIYDPEIPVNIYELGLIYDVDVKEDRSVHVRMTLTAPACPVAGTLPGQVEAKIEEIPEVTKADVELVWDPPWSRELMSEAAQLQLGFM